MADTKMDMQLKSDFFDNLINLPTNILPEKLKNHFTQLRTHPSLLVFTQGQFLLNDRTCLRCHSQWNDGNCSVVVQPTKQPGPCLRRILNKAKRRAKLSPIEKKLAIRRTSNNSVVVTCKVCSKKTTIPTPKPTSKKITVSQGKGPKLVLLSKKKKNKVKKLKKLISKNKKILYDNEPSTILNDITVVENSTMDSTGYPTVIEIPATPPCQTTIIESRAAKKKRKKKARRALLQATANLSAVVTIDLTNGSSADKDMTADFIPLESSTPLNSNKNLNTKPNLCNKTPKKTPVKSSPAQKTKRRSALQKLAALENQRPSKKNNSLKGFLNKL